MRQEFDHDAFDHDAKGTPTEAPRPFRGPALAAARDPLALEGWPVRTGSEGVALQLALRVQRDHLEALRSQLSIAIPDFERPGAGDELEAVLERVAGIACFADPRLERKLIARNR